MTAIYFIGGFLDLTKRQVPQDPDHLPIAIRQPIIDDDRVADHEVYELAYDQLHPPFGVYLYKRSEG